MLACWSQRPLPWTRGCHARALLRRSSTSPNPGSCGGGGHCRQPGPLNGSAPLLPSQGHEIKAIAIDQGYYEWHSLVEAPDAEYGPEGLQQESKTSYVHLMQVRVWVCECG